LPFTVTVEHVPDRELGPLLTQLAEAGFENPVFRHSSQATPGTQPRARPSAVDLAADWRVVRELEGETYQWPKRRDRYAPYRVFMGTTRAEGAVQIGLGETVRENTRGRDRKYVVAFLSSGSPQEPLDEFASADDYERTRELVAVIRGSDGGRRMYSAGDTLPAVYAERFRTEIYKDRIDYPGAWNRLVVVVREDDHDAMLDHALIQSRRRYRA
jgi:hypothetical protein